MKRGTLSYLTLLVTICLSTTECGRIWGTVTWDSNVTNPPSWFETDIASSQLISDTTGRPIQSHIIYASSSGNWWFFYINSTTNVLQTSYSYDLVHWFLGTS